MRCRNRGVVDGVDWVGGVFWELCGEDIVFERGEGWIGLGIVVEFKGDEREVKNVWDGEWEEFGG